MQSKWNSHVLLAGMQNGLATLENSLAVSYKAEHTLKCMIQQSHSYLSKRNGNLSSQNNLFANAYSSFIHNCPKMETTKMSFNGTLVKQTVIHPYQGTLLSNKKKIYYIHNDMDENQRHYTE